MKIQQLTIRNVTSYRDFTTFDFENRINILIGPNGGGKSNLQRVLAVVLSNYFIHQYDFTHDDEQASIKPVSLWSKRIIQANLDKFMGEQGDQTITITLLPEESDLRNIEQIGAHLDDFNEYLAYWESPITRYDPMHFLDEIRKSGSFTYRITNMEIQELEPNTPAWAFREYPRTFFIFMRLSGRIPHLDSTSPVFFFFSERKFDRRIRIQSSQITEHNYFSGFRSAYQAAMGHETNLLHWGSQHFARLYWKAINKAGHSRDATVEDIITEEPAVKLLDKYLRRLGYDWTFGTDEDVVEYEFCLVSDGQARNAEKFSSGEREIVHFLLAMFALNVKDGLVIIDEPELHLHPRWQRIFLSLFREVADDRNNQFIVATHSPVFVAPDTVNDVTRIYRSGGASQRVVLRDVALPKKKNLVRMINSQNNERMFFADRVVLVEGISDRLVMASLVDGLSARMTNNEAIEVIDVGGKHNFKDYKALLTALQTSAYIMADRDYLSQVGGDAIKSLFVHNDGKAWKALGEKKGLDAAGFYRLLDAAVSSGDTDGLRRFWKYFGARHEGLKDGLTEEESNAIDEEVTRLRADDTFVLRDGEMEDYLPPGVRTVEEVVSLLEDRNWFVGEGLEVAKTTELVGIAGAILGASEDLLRELEGEIAAGKAIFPVEAPAPSGDRAAQPAA